MFNRSLLINTKLQLVNLVTSYFLFFLTELVCSFPGNCATGACNVLDRDLFYRKTPPDIRETNIKIFDQNKLVELLDELLVQKLSKNPVELLKQAEYFDFNHHNRIRRIIPKRTLHLGFVGDSRIRQLFAMLYQEIPDYDLIEFPDDVEMARMLFIPRQMIFHSNLLGVLVSYNWFSVLVEDHGRDIFKFFHNWLAHPNGKPENETIIVTPLPDILVIGLGTHHMLQENSEAQEDVYFDRLEHLVPLLQNVSKYSQVIWLNQFPTQEFFGEIGAHNTDVHSLKIWHYNQKANRILANGGIPVWSSAGPIVEEYIRSCLFNKRLDSMSLRYFFNCQDFIHPGLSAMVDIIQILYNLV